MESADVACDVPTVGGVKVLEVLDKRFDEDGRDHDDYDHDGHENGHVIELQKVVLQEKVSFWEIWADQIV